MCVRPALSRPCRGERKDCFCYCAQWAAAERLPKAPLNSHLSCAPNHSRLAYEKGVVIAECPGCNNRHLIADHLGWFEEKGKNVEDFVKERGGIAIRRTATGDLELSPEDLLGKSKLEELMQQQQQQAEGEKKEQP